MVTWPSSRSAARGSRQSIKISPRSAMRSPHWVSSQNASTSTKGWPGETATAQDCVKRLRPAATGDTLVVTKLDACARATSRPRDLRSRLITALIG